MKSRFQPISLAVLRYVLISGSAIIFFLWLYTVATAKTSPSIPTRVSVFGTNLIVNGDAEIGQGTDKESTVPVPGWTTTGKFTVLRYQDLDSGALVPSEKGQNLFYGGPSGSISSASQKIDLSIHSTKIDAGNLFFTLSGYLGGWESQEDHAILTVTFEDISGTPLLTMGIQPVNSLDRGRTTGIIYRDIAWFVPTGSRSVNIHLEMLRTAGNHNDGHADNLSLIVQEISSGAISGNVYQEVISPGTIVAGTLVQACDEKNQCHTTYTSSTGTYLFSNLSKGDYILTAFPPAGSSYLVGERGPIKLEPNERLENQHIILSAPIPPPANTTITHHSTTDDGIPVVHWRDNLTLITKGCPAGQANYQILRNNNVLRSGSLTENPQGTYSAVIAPLYPEHGSIYIKITINCPDTGITDIPFNVWIDPSGVVLNTKGQPISNATITLYRSNREAGPFETVISGTEVMSPANRENPMKSDVNGKFGWDVAAGYYTVRAHKQGCTSPSDSSISHVETKVLTIPPPVTDLVLTLYCGESREIFLPLIQN